MITTPCYCSRQDVKRAADFKLTARSDQQIDRALQSAREDIEGAMHRRFYPEDRTKYFDWPNYQYAYPWRIWFDQNDLVSATTVKAGTTVIASSDYFLEPVNTGPPYTYIELNRSSVAAFGGDSTTPQRSTSITGTWGYNTDMDQVATLAAAISSTSATTLTVSDSSQLDAGDLLIIDTERMLVTDSAMTSTSQTQQGSGAGTAVVSDVALTVTDGTQYHVGEILLLDSERMLIVDIAGNVLTVKRAWDGTTLATHSGATVYAPRLLTVTRGALGTTAATHSNAAPVNKHRYPSLIRELSTAQSLNYVLQELSGYSRTVGEEANTRLAPGVGLQSIWAEAKRRHGRKARLRVA